MAYKKNWPLIASISMVVVLVALMLIHIHAAPKESNKTILFAEENKPNNNNNVQVVKQPNEVHYKGKIIKVEVVSTPQDMFIGLSGREGICRDCGMLFAFPNLEERHFVMRNMLFPLDIIFISDNKVVNIQQNLPPEGADYKNIYSSGDPANYVLEVNAGIVEEYGIKVGDEIEF